MGGAAGRWLYEFAASRDTVECERGGLDQSGNRFLTFLRHYP